MARHGFDLVVLGGGPGGYVAAIRAAQLGMNTALVEREHLGGVCLNWGCIPTKALLRTSELLHQMRHAERFGLACDNVAYDAAAVVARSREVARKLSRGVGHLLEKNKVAVFMGEGRLDGPGRVAVAPGAGGRAVELAAEHVVLATGARARTLEDLAPDGATVWTYREAMVPDAVPASVLIVGAGAIGIEFASFYRDMGAEVTVLEALDRILPAEDEEISGLARTAFARQGMTILTGARIERARVRAGGAVVELVGSDGSSRRLEVDKVILAVGVVGNTEGLGLEGTAARTERGHVATDPFSATGEPGVFAIGDLAGPPWLAHKASHEGVLCVERLAGREVAPLDRDAIAACTYCRPQIASIGLTEAAARAGGHEPRIGRFPFRGNGKATALGEDRGLVKTVFDGATGELLGAHMIGAEVTELIAGFAIAKTLETTELELMATVFPHPTLSEMMLESTLAAYGRALHM